MERLIQIHPAIIRDHPAPARGQYQRSDRAPIRILCVDDNPLVLQTIQRVIAREPGLQVVGSLERADELLAECRRICPDIVLLDIEMPGLSAFVALEQLSPECPDTRVIIVSAYMTQTMVDRAVQSGAWGFVSKYDTSARMLEAIRAVADGKGHFDGNQIIRE